MRWIRGVEPAVSPVAMNGSVSSLVVCKLWFLSRKELNRWAHAINGDTVSDPVILLADVTWPQHHKPAMEELEMEGS